MRALAQIATDKWAVFFRVKTWKCHFIFYFPLQYLQPPYHGCASATAEPFSSSGINFPPTHQFPVMDFTRFMNPTLPYHLSPSALHLPSYLQQPPSTFLGSLGFNPIPCNVFQQDYCNESPIDLSCKPKTEDDANVSIEHPSEFPFKNIGRMASSLNAVETCERNPDFLNPYSFPMLNSCINDASLDLSVDVDQKSEESRFWPQMNSTPLVPPPHPSLTPPPSPNTPSNVPGPTEMQSLFSYFPFGLDQNMVCPLCRKAFRFEKNLLRHLQKAHSTGNGESILKCKLCPYTTRHYSNMYVHIRTHTGK